MLNKIFFSFALKNHRSENITLDNFISISDFGFLKAYPRSCTLKVHTW